MRSASASSAPLALFRLRFLAAGGLQLRALADLLAVLGFEADDRLDPLPLQRFLRGDQEAVLAAGQGHRELRDRHVGHAVEGGADAAFEAVDAADQVDVDLALEVGDEVRQRVVRRAQVDRAFERLAEQRRERPRLAVDRFLRAVVGGELDPGADRREARLVEEQRVRQADRGAGDVGVPRRALRTARRRGCLARLVCAEQAQVQLRAGISAASQLFSWTGSETGKDEKVAGLVGSAPPPLSAPAVANLRAVGPG